MRIEQAINILEPEENTLDAIKQAYRQKAKIYHPDVNPNGTELMKLINEAFGILRDNNGFFSSTKTDIGIDTEIEEIFNKIKYFQGIKAEICGVWLWVTGNTKPYRKKLKEIGLWYAPKKQAWYYKPKGHKSFNKGKWSLETIRLFYGSEDLETENLKALYT